MKKTMQFNPNFRAEYAAQMERRDRAVYREYMEAASDPAIKKTVVARKIAAAYGLRNYTSVTAIVRRVNRKVAEGKMQPVYYDKPKTAVL